MEPNTNLIPTTSSANEDGRDDGVHREKEDGVDLVHKRATESKSNEAIDTRNGSESIDKNQYPEPVRDVVRAKDSEAELDSLDDDVETVIKKQHKYYIYCPCCGEDITKTVKLVKISDPQPTKTSDTENEASDTKNGTKSKDKKKKFPSWFPVNLKQLFHSIYSHSKDKGKKEVDLKSPPVSSIDLGIDDKEPSIIDVSIEKERPSFPKWYLNVFAWLFLCVIIALSVLFTSPHQSPSVLPTSLPSFIPPHLPLPSVSSLQLPSASLLLLLPMFAVLYLVIMAMRTRYSPGFHKEKGNKRVDSKSTYTAREEHNRNFADPGEDSAKKTDNQKVHPAPLETSPHEQASMQIINKETHENAESETQAEPELQSKHTQLKLPNNVEEPRKGGTKLEILKSIVYGGLTESITSLCTVTSAAASGASTLNIFALGVANLSSGLLLIVHNLQELVNEKARKRTNKTDDDQEHSEEEGDRYEEILGRREKSKLHSFIAISSFIVCGMIPPLVYGFSFRQRFEKRQEYKTLAVYGVSLVCVVLLSIAKAYVSKRPEYLKTLFRYTAMATTASGLAQFVGYLVSGLLEKSGFYDDYPDITPRV